MPAKKRSRRAAPARKPAARKPARRATAPKPARKVLRKPSRKAARPAPPRSARKAARKQARTAKPKRSVRASKPQRRARGVQTLPIPRARTRGPQRRRRTPKPPEFVPPVVIEDDKPPAGVVVPSVTPAEIADGEQVDARRYVAVVSEIEGTEPFPAQQEPLFAQTAVRKEVESYPTDIPIALGAALLAASVFSITKPRCATLAVVPTEKGSLVALAYTRCSTPAASPSPTAG